MPTSKIDLDGNVEGLDGKAGPPEVVTVTDVQDPEKLARMLERALRDLADLKRRRNPKTIVYLDRTVDATGTTKYLFAHHLGGRVIWRVVDWDPTVAVTEVRLDKHSDTDENTLVLVSGAAGTVSVEVEAL